MMFWAKASETEVKLVKAISIILRKDTYLLCVLFDPNKPRLSDSIENLLALSAQAFSAKQDILFRVALDVWSGGGGACVWELLEYLDNERLGNVLEGLKYLGTKFNGWDGPVCRQLKLDSDNSRRQLNLDITSKT